MGGTTSKTTSEVLTDEAVSVSMKTIMSCALSASQSQLIQLNNVKGNVTITGTSFKQGASINMQCLMNASKQADISNAVAASLAQSANASGQAVLSAFGKTQSEATSNIKTMISSSINADTSMQVSTNLSQSQSITASNIGGSVVIANVSLDQSAQATSYALMQSSAYASAINDVANKIDQSSSSKETTIFGELANAIGTTVEVVLIAGVLVSGAVVIFIIFMIYY